ncbi:MAG: hypothetical protein QM523_00875 [Candidatus Pacebacteria bacterium]|nr:hypothetical protein [Candidatus Paceibacterota bacterium]
MSAWGPWTLHDDSGLPLALKPGMIVEAEMKLDGEILTPMRVEELDWHCPGDPVAAYRVQKPKGMVILEQLLADIPAPVAPEVVE